MSNKYILSYDHGTSGMKTAIISTQGEIIGFNVEEYELFHYEQGCAEQDPNDWWNSLIKTTQALLSQNLVPIEDIVAICSSNQMDGTIPIDKEGNNLYNCISWMDTRGATAVRELCGGPVAEYNPFKLIKFLRKTGAAPGLSGKDILGHILWLKDAHPEIYKKTWKFMDCKDYLNFRLTGKVATSYDCAVLTFLLNTQDINNLYYDEKLLEMVNIPREKFPDPYPSTHILGTLTEEVAETLGLAPSTKVIIGAGDMGSAQVGSGAIEYNQAHISIGSSSWVMTHSKKRKIDIIHTIPSLPAAIPGRYISFGEQESAGINLSWLRDNILYHKDELLRDEQKSDVYKIFDSLVEQTEAGSKKLIFTPWLWGERCPIEDHTIRGGLHNVSLEIERKHLLRAIYEGVAYNSRWVFEPLTKMVHNRLDPIVLIGGGAISDIWCQIYADVLDRTVKQHAHPKEGVCIGAALIASVALEYITWDQIPDLIKYKKEYKPNPANREIYDELFAEYKAIYKNNKKMYRRLNHF
ncbi:FGGY-family carbohydrate kinase [Promethearchaeum syntrophicum]|uniref:FGGY-family carbohydrate kinase n=1 Tax=Promethearchaeum syntrophicum TaxID=2594042 RepID=A0A5B9DDR8_9ARCH|nr:FGGY-family carbohydrate kinase [Candidatus Prometheoarchaeum syntrophicum]QEE17141.1 Glycerol kinase [Candidatus Prometheoarchaeum syntrophicum]